MLRMGVELYEVDTRQLRNDPLIGSRLGATIGRSHSKLIVIDHQTTFVGSMNMDLRSSRVNTELGMLIESTELATEVLALANRVRSFGAYRLRMSASDSHIEWVAKLGGKEIVYDDDPEVDLSIRVQLLLLFPFISESLL
jgi:putative cardiolipin synthase